MDVTPLLAKSVPYVRSYGPDFFHILGHSVSYPVFLSSQEMRVCQTLDHKRISSEDLSFLYEDLCDFLIIGTGQRLCRDIVVEDLGVSLHKYLSESQLGFEIMDTPRSIGMYNQSILEGRRVRALMFLAHTVF